MGAMTVTGRREGVMGNLRYVMATLNGSTASDTWTTGLKVLKGYNVGDGSNAPVTTTSVSGGVITIGSSGGLTNANGIAWGF